MHVSTICRSQMHFKKADLDKLRSICTKSISRSSASAYLCSQVVDEVTSPESMWGPARKKHRHGRYMIPEVEHVSYQYYTSQQSLTPSTGPPLKSGTPSTGPPLTLSAAALQSKVNGDIPMVELYTEGEKKDSDTSSGVQVGEAHFGGGDIGLDYAKSTVGRAAIGSIECRLLLPLR